MCAKGRKRGGKRGTECANRRSEGRDFSREKVADTNRRSIEAFGETTTRVYVCGLPQIDFLFNLVIVINVQSLARSTSNFLASLCSKVLTSAGISTCYFSFVLIVAILINLQLTSARYR